MKNPDKSLRGILRKTRLAAGIVFIVFIVIAVVILLTQKPEDLQVSNVDLSTISDGIYTGSADNGLVKATVTVEVADGKILSITIIEHDQLLGKKAEKITERIISRQSLEVDAVASATYSSVTIQKAVENALERV